MKNRFWMLLILVSSIVIAQDKKECISVRDSLTGIYIYPEVSQIPRPSNGESILNSQMLRKIQITDSLENSKTIVQFIVDIDGSIKGERMLSNPEVGKQLISIIKNIQWKPALCNNKAVPFLVTIPLTICLR